MYSSKFADDLENMLKTLHNAGLQMGGINYFLSDFDNFCIENFPYESLLTMEIAEKWIHNTTSESKAHMWRRVNAMKHLGKYQLSLGKAAYITNLLIRKPRAEEPHLFTDEQLAEFFEIVDTQTKPTKTFPYNDIIFPVMLRLIYCCGLRSSEACNLKIEDIDFALGALDIYRGKNFRDRRIFMSDDICDLCLRFHKYYSKILPDRTYFFQPSQMRERYISGDVTIVFDKLLKKTSFYGSPGKKFTEHGLRHLFAVQNIRNCSDSGENFSNWVQFLSKVMGHKNIQFTKHYLHITSQSFPVYSEKLKLLGEGIGVLRVED